MPALKAREPPPLRHTATLPGVCAAMNWLTVRGGDAPAVAYTAAEKEPETAGATAIMVSFSSWHVLRAAVGRLSHRKQGPLQHFHECLLTSVGPVANNTGV